MADELDSPPKDYGSDRFDYIEVSAPEGVYPPPDLVFEAADGACQDCRANVFFRVDEPEPDWPPSEGYVDDQGRRWFVAVAHDDGCPTAAAMGI